ncbi:MAG: DUF192 domain-containing protein [Rhizobiaceae bacterium]|nr:DUF192 domain-containing protein [Rhizobiaceae bacterium]
MSSGRTVLLTALPGLILISFALTVLAGSDRSPPAANPTERCTLYFSGNISLANVPVARTAAQMAQGLMYREDAGSGMLFSWPSTEPRVFWMRNTHMPLSVGFISADGTLFAIEDMAPNTDDYHYSIQPASDALELAQGAFVRNGLTPGSRLIRRECRPD